MPVPSADLPSLKVLLVDDDREMLKLLRIMLQRIGVTQVTLFSDPREALTLPAVKAPDVVISDWEMASMEGGTFVERFRRTPAATPTTGYFFVTGRPVAERVETAKRLRVQGFMAKPVSPKVLRVHLERYVERRGRLGPRPGDAAPPPVPRTDAGPADDDVVEI